MPLSSDVILDHIVDLPFSGAEPSDSYTPNNTIDLTDTSPTTKLCINALSFYIALNHENRTITNEVMMVWRSLFTM